MSRARKEPDRLPGGLPDPDSPTSATVLPGRIRIDRSSTAFTRPASVRNSTVRLRMVRSSSPPSGRRSIAFMSLWGHGIGDHAMTAGQLSSSRHRCSVARRAARRCTSRAVVPAPEKSTVIGLACLFISSATPLARREGESSAPNNGEQTVFGQQLGRSRSPFTFVRKALRQHRAGVSISFVVL